MSERLEWYMGNDNEIKKTSPKKTDVFFKNELMKSGEPSHLYSLEKEFAKTKKNRQPLFYLSVVFFIAALAVAAYLITTIIKESTSNIAIKIHDFKSLNLTELFNSAQKIDGKLRRAQRELYDVRQTMNSKISIVRDNIESERQLLYTRSLSPARRKSALGGLARKERYRVAAVRRRYVGRIIKLQKEINKLRKESARFGKQLKRGKVAFDNYNRLKDMELRKVREQYDIRIRDIKRAQRIRLKRVRDFHARYIESLILLYNPKFHSGKLKSMVNDALASGAPKSISSVAYPGLLGAEGLLSAAGYTKLQNYVKNDLSLIGRLLKVPYTNSAARGLRSINILTRNAFSLYDFLWKKMLNTIARKNGLLKKFNSAFDMMAKNAREHGFVVNAQDSNAVVVVINDRYYVRNGDVGYVIRSGKKKIATLSFYAVRDGIRARVTKIDPKVAILPFDKILIKLK